MSERFRFIPFTLKNIKLLRAAVQTIATGTQTVIIWDSPTVYSAENFSYNAATGVVTIGSTGWYEFTCSTFWAASAAGQRYVEALINDGTNHPMFNSISSTAILTTGNVLLSFQYRIAKVGSTVDFRCLQNTGANLNLGGSDNLYASIVKIGELP